MKLTNVTFKGMVCLIISLTTLFISPLKSQTSLDRDRSLSPYFAVKSDNPEVDRLPLKSTEANVVISGVIADVTVTQTYCNEGENVLEAIYVFPASTNAAIYAMQMEIGKRILFAQIKEKEQARQEYEEAKEEGKTVSLLEQERPNVFKMNVANILPGDTINVEMKYTELITPVDGIYEFVYPTVVGPRYKGEDPNSGEQTWLEAPYSGEGVAPVYDFDISITIHAGMEINEVTCISHNAITFTNNSSSSITCNLDPEAKNEGNKDFILQYQLSGEGIESGVLLFEGEEENFFLALIQPPKNPDNSFIPPREYVFIMDVSGSMNGFPIETSKEVLTDLLYDLKTDDKFNILYFAGGANVLSTHPLDATGENINKAISMIDNQYGAGGTNILNALQVALNMEGTENYARSFVISTDGYVSVEKGVFDLIRNNLNNANFFSFGIGSSVNRFIIEGIAHMGMSEPFVVTKPEEASEKAELFRKYIEMPMLTNIDMDFDNFEVYDVEPISVPDVLAERPVLVFGKYKGEAKGKIKLSGISGTDIYSTELDLSKYAASEGNSALKYLWARHKLKLLSDYGTSDYSDEMKNEITNLGLKYSLLTKYTSFIAVDIIVRNTTDTSTTINQQVPLPEGVTDMAVGGMAMDEEIIYNKCEVNSRSYLQLNYPNPFTEITKLKLFVDVEDLGKPIFIEVYNSLGQFVKIVDVSGLTSGWQEIEFTFDESNTKPTPGLYFARMLVDDVQTSSITINYISNLTL